MAKSPKSSSAQKQKQSVISKLMEQGLAGHTLTAFLPNPSNLTFDTQEASEKVILILRRHPITLIKNVLITVGGLFFPWLLKILPLFDSLPAKYETAINLGWYLLVLGFALETFLVWYFSVYIITDERIIDVDFLNIIYKNISSAKIENIEDITINASGALSTIFDYGTILAQTAAERTEFEFEDVPQPSRVASLLNELLLQEEQERIEGKTH